MYGRLQELERETLAHVFDWIQREPAFLGIIGHSNNLCWVSGGSGMGKSTMAFKMFRHLKETFAHDNAVHVACFFCELSSPGDELCEEYDQVVCSASGEGRRAVL